MRSRAELLRQIVQLVRERDEARASLARATEENARLEKRMCVILLAGPSTTLAASVFDRATKAEAECARLREEGAALRGALESKEDHLTADYCGLLAATSRVLDAFEGGATVRSFTAGEGEALARLRSAYEEQGAFRDGLRERFTRPSPAPSPGHFCDARAKGSVVGLTASLAAPTPKEDAPRGRGSACGSNRIPLDRAGTRFGACSLVSGPDGTGGCPDPLRDYEAEQTTEDSAPQCEACEEMNEKCGDDGGSYRCAAHRGTGRSPSTTGGGREPKTCSQCGKPFSARACGPTHALIAAERAAKEDK